MAEAVKRYAVVTGGNKGIGFGICKQLASNGIFVVLTARDQKKGLKAVDKLKSEFGVSGQVVSLQLDVTDPASVSTLANFIRTKFGKLDILVNNAGVRGSLIDKDGLVASEIAREKGISDDWSKTVNQDYESAEAAEVGIRTNYYGAKEMCQALIPLLEFSDSPRIVSVSSIIGKLENIPSGWAKEVLSEAENLTEEKLDEVMTQLLEDIRQGPLENKGWPLASPVYVVSKACLNAYTRILARKYPSFSINAVCPGYVKTDLNFNTGHLTVDEGAESVVRLALQPSGGHSGLFFNRKDVASF